jgi:hypothetical protein
MRAFASCLTVILLFAAPVDAQNYSGTFNARNDAGGVVTLVLTQDMAGQVTGTLASDGVSYVLNGVLEEGSVLGTVTAEQMGLYFAAEFDAGDLHLTLFEAGANNEPNYDTGQTIVFARAVAAERKPSSGPPAKPPKPSGRSTTTVGGDVSTGLVIAFGLPRIVAMNAYLSRALVVEAVYQATALSGAGMMGQVTNTGTLSPGYGGGFQYSPQPADRLIVNLGPQEAHEFIIRQAQGNIQARTAAEWVMSPHVLQYSHRLQSQAEAEMSAQFNGTQFQVQVQGWYMQSGTRYDLNLSATGHTSGSSGYDGQDAQTQYDLTGSISGGGFEVEVHERHTSSMASATSLRLLPSQRGSASRFNGILNSILRIGGDEYRFQNVQVQTDQRTRGTATGQAGLTMLEGMVMRSGQPFGRLVPQSGQAFLQTQSGLLPLDMPISGSTIR